MNALMPQLRASVALGTPQAGAQDRGHLSRAGRCVACGFLVADHYDGGAVRGCEHARSVARRRASVLRESGGEAHGERPGR